MTRLFPRRPRHPQLWVAWLAFALCLAATLGQMHRIAHAPGLGVAASHAGHGHGHAREHELLRGFAHVAHPALGHIQAQHAHDDLHDHAQAAPLPGWGALFGVHDEAECRLYDQLSADPALPAVVQLLLPVQPPMARLRHEAGDFVARWAAMFDARGPPGARASCV